MTTENSPTHTSEDTATATTTSSEASTVNAKTITVTTTMPQPTTTPSTKPAVKKRKKNAPKDFKTAFNVLKSNAQLLQQQSEPDIDSLMNTVEESIAAYRVCQERIDAVQSALDMAFSHESSNQESTTEK